MSEKVAVETYRHGKLDWENFSSSRWCIHWSLLTCHHPAWPKAQRPFSCRLSPAQVLHHWEPRLKLHSSPCHCLLVSRSLPVSRSPRIRIWCFYSTSALGLGHTPETIHFNDLLSRSCYLLSQGYILLLAYSASLGFTTLVYHSVFFLILRTAATQPSVPNWIRPLNDGCQFGMDLSLQSWSFSFSRDD